MSPVQPVDVVLHIGSDKTGTTSLQQLFRHNREALARRGVLYPRSPGRVRHAGLGFYARPDDALVTSRDWRRGEHPPPAVYRRRLLRRLAREVAASDAATALLSDEELFRLSTASILRLRGLLEPVAGSVRVVAYLRRQDDHLVSRYQQAVKVGEARRLSTWARRDFSTLYDYAARVTTWRDTLEPDRLVVRPFEKERFSGGSLAQDFLDASGIDVPAAALQPVEVRNESLGVEAVEVLRILNLHRITNLGLEVWQISNRDHVRRLRDDAAGPQVTLPDRELDRFMAQWEETNRRVAVEVLGDRSGELFRAPRRTAGRTTEQVLDPARLDHYLELLGLPEDQHAAIRRIAEREAVRPTSD